MEHPVEEADGKPTQRARGAVRSRVGSPPPPRLVQSGASTEKPAASLGTAAAAGLDKQGGPQEAAGASYDKGTNWVRGGLGTGSVVMPLLLIFCPIISQLAAHVTSEAASIDPTIGVSGMLSACASQGTACLRDLSTAVVAARPSVSACKFLLAFNGLALMLDILIPGRIQCGPQTLTGHIPAYKDNGMWHCILFSLLFIGGSNLAWEGLYDFGVIYDLFPASAATLNIFGLLFALFLYFKGIYWPSTKDAGSSGSFVVDYSWGTELYPKVLGVDVKRFINCRFSMTFWMLAGLSYAFRSYKLHGSLDHGLLISALSTYLYLVKFFLWEIGYLRSIDIIVDRAGYQIQWGCLVWVPCVYSFHTRFLVRHPSQLSLPVAAAIGLIGFVGVLLNYWADEQRKRFREANGQLKIWGKPPEFVRAEYVIEEGGRKVTKTSLLLACGFWGFARHFHYVFELIAAWSWCLLANPLVNGAVPLFYGVFLTILLLHRAKRDEDKCRKKYGKDYDRYCELVPYLVIPGLF